MPQTLSQYFQAVNTLQNAGTYEIYKIITDITNETSYIITNINTNKSILVNIFRNKIEIDESFINDSQIKTEKVSFTDFLESINGIGVYYLADY